MAGRDPGAGREAARGRGGRLSPGLGGGAPEAALWL